MQAECVNEPCDGLCVCVCLIGWVWAARLVSLYTSRTLWLTRGQCGSEKVWKRLKPLTTGAGRPPKPTECGREPISAMMVPPTAVPQRGRWDGVEEHIYCTNDCVTAARHTDGDVVVRNIQLNINNAVHHSCMWCFSR